MKIFWEAKDDVMDKNYHRNKTIYKFEGVKIVWRENSLNEFK